MQEVPQEAIDLNQDGRVLLSEGRLEEALAAFSRAIDLAPDYAAAYQNRADVLERLGRQGEAEANRRTAEQLLRGPTAAEPAPPAPAPAPPPPATGPLLVCPRCSAHRMDSVFCKSCNLFLEDTAWVMERATLTRRFFGDILLEGLLALVTLYIGWFIWLYFTAKTSQTPAKRLLKVYIIERKDYVDMKVFRPASAGRVWLREVVVKILGLWIVNWVSGGLANLIDYAWAIWDKDRQALHDKIVSTIIVYAPLGLVRQA